MIMLCNDDYVVEYGDKFYRLSGIDGYYWLLSEDNNDEFVRALAVNCILYKRHEPVL